MGEGGAGLRVKDEMMDISKSEMERVVRRDHLRCFEVDAVMVLSLETGIGK